MPIDPFDPRPCCILQVCCSNDTQEMKAKRHAHLTAFLEAKTAYGKLTFAGVAQTVLDHFDLVPKGVGAAIVEGYKPYFKAQSQTPQS